MAEECTHDCSTCGENCASREAAEDMSAKLHEMSSVKRVIGIVSGKGGVGKSMITSLLAVLMQRRGHHAAIMDADMTGPSIPKAFGITEKAEANEFGLLPVRTKTGIDLMSINLLLEDETSPVVWRGPVIGGAVKQFWTDVIWTNIDYMFVDMPPGTGDVPLTVFQSLPVDGIIMVTSPQELVSMIVGKAVKMAQLMEVPIIGVVENMSYITCPDCGKKIELFGKSRIAEISEQYGLPVLGQLPIDPKLAGGVDEGFIELFDGNWLDAAAEQIERLFPL